MKTKTKNITGRMTISQAIVASKQAKILWKDFVKK